METTLRTINAVISALFFICYTYQFLYIPLVLLVSTAAVAVVLLRGGYLVAEQALELAIDAAAKKADVMASAAGMRITGLESITENNSYDTSYGINSMSDGGAVSTRAESVETGIRSGSISAMSYAVRLVNACTHTVLYASSGKLLSVER